MSSKKNRNRNNRQQPVRETAAEQLTKQLNTEDDNNEPSDSSSILAEYERKASEAEQRMAERLKRSEQERAEKEMPQPSADMSAPDTKEPGSDKETADGEPESDVKQFVPKSNTPDPKESFADGFNEALSENYNELDEENTEPQEEQSEEEAPARPNRFFLVFAVFVIIMSIIGVISSVNFLSGVISDIANRTELKNEIALFLYPIVSVDPPDCNSPDELPTTITVEAAIWRIILTGDNSNYEKLYNTYMYVPAIDVEFSIRSIFGSTVDIKHQTVGTMDITFTYIEDMNSYLVPINPHYTAYSPRITDVTNIGELYTVTVEYIPPSALAVEGIEFEVSATKTMVYTLSKSRNSTTLQSIKNITRIENSYGY
ncbi:MAG: hypothetical protein IJT87_00115 [Ruminiclostridium sp.]|nr:hypothetical protein [Ruminiclostridium sp.]